MMLWWDAFIGWLVQLWPFVLVPHTVSHTALDICARASYSESYCMLPASETGSQPFALLACMQGFDSDCARNALSIGGQWCGIVSCTTSYTQALFPGNGTAADNLNVTVMVRLALQCTSDRERVVPSRCAQLALDSKHHYKRVSSTLL